MQSSLACSQKLKIFESMIKKLKDLKKLDSVRILDIATDSSCPMHDILPLDNITELKADCGFKLFSYLKEINDFAYDIVILRDIDIQKEENDNVFSEIKRISKYGALIGSSMYNVKVVGSYPEVESSSDLGEIAENEIIKYKSINNELLQENEKLKQKYADLKNAHLNIVNSKSWKFTMPLRKFIIKIQLLKNKIKNLKNHKKPGLSKEEIKRQKETHFDKSPMISILTPLYNTDGKLLSKTICSVLNQTYSNWQLCLADASDGEHSYVGKVVSKYAQKDNRIKYIKVENKGISDNTNKCADIAEGNYVTLLDHDDILSQDALFEIVKAINEHDPDVIYTDEDKINDKDVRSLPFYKPDWSRDLLYSQMYICHMLVIKKSLFENIGGFDSKFDGAQDFDLMLRLSEKAKNIYHIPKVLYSWRMTETSTSVNPDSKPYAHDAGKNALNAHLKRMYGTAAKAVDSEMTFVYDTKFDLLSDKLVSIIIPTKDNVDLLEKCVLSILRKSSYQNFEIIILNNNSEEKSTYEWFGKIKEFDKRIKVLDAFFEFNWSKLNNFGIEHANGDVFIFLNNDTTVISSDWIERLANDALRDDIGAAGPLLLYQDNTIQHAGVVIGMNGWADHVFKGMQPIHFGAPYVSPMVSRNVLAVTGACMAVSRKTVNKIGKFNEEFIICGSDVEYCLRAYRYGLRNIYNAFTRLYHLESKTRDSFVPQKDFEMSAKYYSPFREGNDPYFNVNLDKNSCIPHERIDI